MTRRVDAVYAASAETIKPRFDQIDAASLYAPLAEWLPHRPARVLDIGAGTGRDARWFDGLGHQVTAVDPVAELRAPCPASISWHIASLPKLAGLAGPFDLITLSGVWHHIPPQDRDASMARIAALCAPSGICLMSLRNGAGFESTVWPAEVPPTCAQAQIAGFEIAGIVATAPQQEANRQAGVRFTWLALKAPHRAQGSARDARTAAS